MGIFRLVARLWILLSAVVLGEVCASETSTRPISTILELRALPREKAAENRPVRVRGVITAVIESDFFVQDETDGGYVSSVRGPAFNGPPIDWDKSGKPAVGMLVEVWGVSMPGTYAPLIALEGVRNLGTAPLPKARTTTLTELLAGAFNCQRVELQGVVCSSSFKRGLLRLDVLVPGGSFSAFVSNPGELEHAPLIDAEVSLRGICLGVYNSRGELIGARLKFLEKEDVKVLVPADPDPFAAPEAAALALRPFRSGLENLHRQRLSGVITLARPGQFLYVQCKERAFRVNTRSREEFTPGDAVEASGFVTLRQNFAELDEAVVRRVGRAPVPEPLLVTKPLIVQSRDYLPWILRTEDYDGARVRVRGLLVKTDIQADEGPMIYLECDGSIITASLGKAASTELSQFSPGSLVEATGICVVRITGPRRSFAIPMPEGFSLLLQDTGSLHVLRAPSWWTRERIAKVFWTTLVALAAVLCWVFTLRYRLRMKGLALTAEIHSRRDASLEFEATLRERNRLAVNLHDTLLQTIGGIGYQLDACAVGMKSQEAQTPPALELARRMVEHASSEVRGSVWALRNLPLQGHNFTEALRALPEKVSPNPQACIVVDAEGALESVPEFVSGNALLILQEAILNALRHGQAQNITISVRAATSGGPIELTVEDDGKGFTPGTQAGPNQGHFGLVGMRERAQRLGGTLVIESIPGRGTVIRATLLQSTFDQAFLPPR